MMMFSAIPKSPQTSIEGFFYGSCAKIAKECAVCANTCQPEIHTFAQSFVVEKRQKEKAKTLLDEAVFFSSVLTLP